MAWQGKGMGAGWARHAMYESALKFWRFRGACCLVSYIRKSCLIQNKRSIHYTVRYCFRRSQHFPSPVRKRNLFFAVLEIDYQNSREATLN
jgi:hypothetical protein